MKFILNNDKLKIQEPECKNSGSINYYLVDVEFNEEWEGLNIEGRLTPKEGSCCNNDGRAIAVINNKLFIDNSINGYYAIGFIGFKVKYVLTQDTAIDLNKTYYTRSGQEGSYVYTKVENPVIADISNYYEAIKDYQISTNLQGIWFNQGAGEIEVTNDDIPTPSQWEIYIEQIQNMIDGLEGLIPTKLSQLQNDNYTVQDENYVHTDNNFSNEDKGKLDGLENYDDTEIKDDIQEINGDIEEINTNLLNYSLITETGSKIDLEINSSTYELVAKLYDKNNNLISTSRKIDLPIESMVVSGFYDSVNKKIILTLDNGNTIDIPVGNLISGLQTEITSENKLESDLVDDTNQNNKFVTTQEKTAWNAKYDKPNSGISKTDLSSEVQESLDKADTAIQESDLADYVTNDTLEDSQAIQDEKITAIEKQIPTGEVNDTSITLTDSADYWVKEFGIEGNTEQATSTQNANLFDEQKYLTEQFLTGTYKYASVNFKGNKILYVKAQLKQGKTAISDLYVCITSNGANPNQGISKFAVYAGTSGGGLQDYTNYNDLYIAFYPTTYTWQQINEVYNIWVSTDDISYVPFVPDSPSPEYPSPVNTITGDVEVKVQNGNLAWNGWAEDFVNRINDNIKAKIETKDNKSCLFFPASAGYQDYDIKYLFKTSWKKNTAYTIDFDVYTSSSDANMVIEYTDGVLTRITGIQTGIWTHLNITSISSKTIKYIRPYYSSGTTYIDLETFMVVEGTTAGEYIPHQEQNYTISLGDIELCKIGDYQDKLFKAINGNTVYDSLTSEQKAGLTYGNWYKYGAIGKVVLDGSENYTMSVYDDINNFYYTLGRVFKIQNNLISYVSNNFKGYGQTSSSLTYNYDGGMTFDTTTPYNIRFKTNIVSTVEEFKAWLSTHNTEVYYVLETPTITQITDTTLINQLNALEQAYTYKGVTHIDTDVETKPYLKVVYRKDIGLILERIENLEARVSLLE